MPTPASLVALSPRPISMRVYPASRAARMRSPVPLVVVIVGSRSAMLRSERPEAAETSMTAVSPSPSTPHRAAMGRPRGSQAGEVT